MKNDPHLWILEDVFKAINAFDDSAFGHLCGQHRAKEKIDKELREEHDADKCGQKPRSSCSCLCFMILHYPQWKTLSTKQPK